MPSGQLLRHRLWVEFVKAKEREEHTFKHRLVKASAQLALGTVELTLGQI